MAQLLLVLLALPLLSLLPADNPLQVSAYTLTLVGKILCYAIVALALLVVLGQCPSQEYAERLRSLAGDDPRVQLRIGALDIPDDEVLLWMAASNAKRQLRAVQR